MRHSLPVTRLVSFLDFPSFWEGLSLRPQTHRRTPPRRRKFPFLLGRAFIEAPWRVCLRVSGSAFPFLLGRAFIEAIWSCRTSVRMAVFPSSWEGLSLRQHGMRRRNRTQGSGFPYNFVGTFIEAVSLPSRALLPLIISSLSSGDFH